MIICWVPSSQFYEAALLLFLIYRQINWGLEKLTGYAKYSLFAPPHPVFALPSACGGQVFRPAGAGSSSWASCWMPALGGGSRISAAWGEIGHNVYFPSSLSWVFALLLLLHHLNHLSTIYQIPHSSHVSNFVPLNLAKKGKIFQNDHILKVVRLEK